MTHLTRFGETLAVITVSTLLLRLRIVTLSSYCIREVRVVVNFAITE